MQLTTRVTFIGVLVSPAPRRIPLHASIIRRKTKKPPTIWRYPVPRSAIFGSALIRINIVFAKHIKNGVTVMPIMSDIMIACAPTIRARSFSFAPIYLATILAEPALREEKIMEIIKKRVPARPTAAMASVPRRPTIIVSEIKTLMCRIFSIAIGRHSLKIFLLIFFSVRSSRCMEIEIISSLAKKDRCGVGSQKGIFSGSV
jgi:hypothetical protein